MTNSSRYHLLHVSATNTPSTLAALPGRTSATPGGQAGSERLLVAASRAQAYYWKRSWQDAEREALAEIEAGQGKAFESAEAVIRYLLAPGE